MNYTQRKKEKGIDKWRLNFKKFLLFLATSKMMRRLS